MTDAAPDASLDPAEIARRGQEVRMRIRARLDALRADANAGPSPTAGGPLDPALVDAVRRANQDLIAEIGRAAEEVLGLAEQEASRLLDEAANRAPQG
jgi:cell division septum initiation protein DivIVA